MIIKITPGVDPYAQLDMEEEELEYKVGDETASEIHLTMMMQMICPA